MLSADLDLEVEQDILDKGGTIVLCPDNDKAGASIARKYLKKGYSIFVWTEQIQGFKDMNEARLHGWSALDKLIKANIWKGVEAEVRLNLSQV